MIYPDSTGPSDRVTYTYNRPSQRTSTTDQNGTVRAFDFDLLGRQTQDRVITLGTGVDGTVRRLQTAYDARGNAYQVTSFDSPTVGGGNVVNEVLHLYNDFNQTIQTYQSHDGAVDLLITPSVRYAYADGSNNTIRPTGIIYPDGRQINFDYGTSGSITDRTSQIASILDADSTHLADYQRLGMDQVVQQNSPQADLQFTLVSLTGTNDPDTGDIYAGLDRFGRVKDNRWRNTASDSDLSRVRYGYDRASNRIWRENLSDTNRQHDWLYGHDGLHRLHTAERGQLDVSHTAITAPQFNQCWTLDPTGNWQGFRQDDDGSGNWDLIQARTANPVNEITGIDNTTGASWATPTYDANGNTTSLPRPDLGADKSTATIWDAWNRPVRFRDPNANQTLVEIGYDARNFRILHRPFAAGVAGDTRHYYFTDQWQAVEERLGSSTTPERQHIWGLRYIDDLLLRDRAPSGSGSLSERLYFLADANWNITAAVDAAVAVQERIEYTPYGLPQFLTPIFGVRTASLFDIRYSCTGREWLPELALYYFRNRLYSPLLGRFISRDPIGYEEEKLVRLVPHDGARRWSTEIDKEIKEQQIHLYQYVGSSPLLRLDPTGMLFGWGYGNYCGWSRRGQNGPPIDALDAACKRHDECQASWWTCNPYHFVKCSIQFCSETDFAVHSGCSQSYPNDPDKRDACKQGFFADFSGWSLISRRFCTLGG